MGSVRLGARGAPVLVLALAGLALAGEDYSSWSSSRELLVDASPAGANVATDLTGFPLGLSLGAESADLFTQAKPDGSDLRFAAADGTHLPYQIEAWDAAGKKAAIWVGLPSVKAGQVLHLRAYWGKPSAADSSSGPAVFGAADGFKGVWHMGSTADASANGITAQDSGTVADPAGRVGAARSFPNTADAYAATGAYMALGNPAALNITGIITMEAWVKWTRRDKHRIIICHGGGIKPAAVSETVLRIGETLDYRAGVWTGKDHYAKSVVPPSDSGMWVHLGGVFDGSKWRLYRNGEKVDSLVSDTGAMPSTGGWRIGAEFATIPNTTTNTATRFFSGSLDEVRIASVARSADWFKLAYATQKEGQTVVKWSGATGVRANLPAARMRNGSQRAGLWNSPKAGKPGLIDASGALVPSP
jgi:hypothetical protein